MNMHQNKKISVCVAFYNIKPYVSRCLDSIIGNTYKNLQIICVNDGSTDGTGELLHEYAKKDSRIVVIDKENGGIVSARNAALDVVSGDLISFIDGDDWIHKRYFETMISVMEKSCADVVVCGHIKTDRVIEDQDIESDLVPFSLYGLDSVPHDREVRVLIWGRIFSKKLKPELRVDKDICRGEDAIQNIMFLCKCSETKIAVIPEKLYYYFQRSDSLVHTVSHEYIRKMCDFFINHPELMNSEAAKKIILHEILREVLAYRYLTTYSSDRNEQKKYVKSIFDFCVNHWSDTFTLFEKAKYLMLFYNPQIYRLFRIITDPTMLAWEQSQKNGNNEQIKL